jgi:multicomponent Na+:H+ antiporter subunit D
MGGVAALAVLVPLLGAGVTVAAGPFAPGRVLNVLATAAAASTTVLCVALLTQDVRVIEWFGGWEPRDGNVAVGIDFAVDRFGAGIASLAAVLVTAALAFSWRYFEQSGPLFAALVLLFLGGVVGFALTGDLFNWFVFFELMSVAAFALTAYSIEEEASIQGALTFAVTNSLGAFMIVAGIALLYGRTGALNLAQIGRQLQDRPADGLVVTAFTLIAVGFLVKAGAVPFHFWLADAYAAAPAPICALFAGVMCDLGVFALARAYWTMFEAPFAPHEGDVRAVLVGAGALTALVGAVMCVLQRHLKRLLAYSTISHIGIFVIGVGLLTGDALAGVALYVLAHGLAKAALFLLTGIVLGQIGSVDELRLRGAGRALPITGALFAVGGFVLTGPPLLGVFLGKSLLDEAAVNQHLWWLAAVGIVASALTAGAVLRAAGRVFLGLGVEADRLLSPEPEEEEPLEEEPTRPPFLLGVAALLLAGALALGFAPGLAPRALAGAEQFRDRSAYVAEVLGGQTPEAKPLRAHHTKPESVILSLVTLAGALAVAVWGLRGHPLPRLAVRPLDRLRALHTGAVGDYVAWLVLGAAVLGGLVTLAVR